jgi:hypothetical protein
MITLSSKGELEERKAFIIFATNCTSIGTQKLYDDGWKQIADNTLTSEKAFYKVVDPQEPIKGDNFELYINVPLDTTAAATSTGFSANFWLIDMQKEANVAIGSVSTSVPTAYGFIGEFGIDALIYAKAYSTSSGASTGFAIYADFTTAS